MTDDKWTVDDLLDLAGVVAGNRDKAQRWLRDTSQRARGAPQVSDMQLARALARVANPDLVPADDDRHLDQLAKKVGQLLTHLHALRRRPYQHMAFWGNEAFGPIEPAHYMRKLDTTLPIETLTGLERDEVIQALRNIIAAAKAAKANRSANRRKAHHKESVVESAALFWLQYSPHEISETGKFFEFAEAFHEAATGRAGNVERAVRAVVRRVKAGEIF